MLYITKAWGNVYVVGSGSYTWSGYEQRKTKRWLQILSLVRAKGVTTLEKKVRYAPNMVFKHSQKET